MSALLKRIQRDRNEQLKHRQIDSQRLIQRNKNLLLDLLNKQNMETRRTNQFLRVALGIRSPSRAKLYKSKFYEMHKTQQDTQLQVVDNQGQQQRFDRKNLQTSYLQNRSKEPRNQQPNLQNAAKRAWTTGTNAKRK